MSLTCNVTLPGYQFILQILVFNATGTSLRNTETRTPQRERQFYVHVIFLSFYNPQKIRGTKSGNEELNILQSFYSKEFVPQSLILFSAAVIYNIVCLPV